MNSKMIELNKKAEEFYKANPRARILSIHEVMLESAEGFENLKSAINCMPSSHEQQELKLAFDNLVNKVIAWSDANPTVTDPQERANMHRAMQNAMITAIIEVEHSN